jgi:hypothetical protein
VRRSGDKKAPKTLEDLEDMVVQQRQSKSVIGEISAGAHLKSTLCSDFVQEISYDTDD